MVKLFLEILLEVTTCLDLCRLLPKVSGDVGVINLHSRSCSNNLRLSIPGVVYLSGISRRFMTVSDRGHDYNFDYDLSRCAVDAKVHHQPR